jgi:hypothetical protein
MMSSIWGVHQRSPEGNQNIRRQSAKCTHIRYYTQCGTGLGTSLAAKSSPGMGTPEKKLEPTALLEQGWGCQSKTFLSTSTQYEERASASSRVFRMRDLECEFRLGGLKKQIIRVLSGCYSQGKSAECWLTMRQNRTFAFASLHSFPD